MKKYDVVVIGSGTGGQTTAHDLAAEGYSVALIEKSDTPGGICALHGCQAKKYLYEVAEIVARANHLQGLGVTSPPNVNWGQIIDQKNDFTSKVPENTVKSLKGSNIAYLEGNAVFSDPHNLVVDGETITADFFIIATGASPRDLSVDGASHVITSNEFLGLNSIPRRVTFIGGGYISFEFAHFACRLGSEPGEVRILESNDRVLGAFDSELVKELTAASSEDGIVIETGVNVVGIEKLAEGFRVHRKDGKAVDTDLVVNGTGRSADISGLNLEQANVAFSADGIEVNSHMQTSTRHIYAVGDCTATLQLARVADKEAHVAATNIIARLEDGEPQQIDYTNAPAILFTYPQLGMVGKTEDQLKADGVRYWRSFESELRWPTYKRVGLKRAAYKILVDENNLILGAHILSDNCTGLINTIRQAMIEGTPTNELYDRNILTPYPSRESDILYMLSALID